MGIIRFLRGGIDSVPPLAFVTDELGTFETDYNETMRLHKEEGWYTYLGKRVIDGQAHHYFRF